MTTPITVQNGTTGAKLTLNAANPIIDTTLVNIFNQNGGAKYFINDGTLIPIEGGATTASLGQTGTAWSGIVFAQNPNSDRHYGAWYIPPVDNSTTTIFTIGQSTFTSSGINISTGNFNSIVCNSVDVQNVATLTSTAVTVSVPLITNDKIISNVNIEGASGATGNLTMTTYNGTVFASFDAIGRNVTFGNANDDVTSYTIYGPVTLSGASTGYSPQFQILASSTTPILTIDTSSTLSMDVRNLDTLTTTSTINVSGTNNATKFSVLDASSDTYYGIDTVTGYITMGGLDIAVSNTDLGTRTVKGKFTLFDTNGNAQLRLSTSIVTDSACFLQTCNVLPFATTTYDIGSSTYQYNNIYCVAVTQSSDARLKTNITPVANSINAIKSLKPVTFRFTHAPDTRAAGFIAQQVQEVFRDVHPDIVAGSDQLALKYTEFIPFMVDVLQRILDRLDM